MPSTVTDVFSSCVQAVQQGVLIQRESRSDKEFHFQNWVSDRIDESGHPYEAGGRNSYPDFRIVRIAEGFEVKGLAYPGRWLSYDSNSQVPSGEHNGRTIYYVFGRYPKEPDGDRYPVLDLVVCHGDFLNADHGYVHQNRSVKGFGSYGDVMIRDRKMYVAPTPYGLLDGVAHTQTLVLPERFRVPQGYKEVGQLVRREVEELIVAYRFDLRSNEIEAQRVPNPSAGREHVFRAWRMPDGAASAVTLRAVGVEDVLPDAEQ